VTAVVAFFVGLFQSIANIKQLAAYAEEFAAAVMLWYVQRATSETLAGIADAAAAGARSQTKEERFKAADLWQQALSRKRVSQ
jgi:hypothetical protein